jgi:hypothetical protein
MTDTVTKKRSRPGPAAALSSAAYRALTGRARHLGLGSVTEWCRMILSNQLPSPLPARPELEYPELFLGDPALAWQEFLGLHTPPKQAELDLLPDVDQRGYVEFEYATEMAKSLGLKTVEDWYRRAGNLHSCCPREPWALYFTKGYTSLEEFIGLPAPIPAQVSQATRDS